MRVSKSAVTAIRNAGYRTYYRYGPSSVIICKEYICGACYRLSIIVGRNEQINERAMFAFPFRSSPLSGTATFISTVIVSNMGLKGTISNSSHCHLIIFD